MKLKSSLTTIRCRKRPAFHHVIYRGSQAKNLNQSSLQVGERVYIDGWIQSRPFTLPNNKTRTETSIIANRFHICQRLPDGGDDGMFGKTLLFEMWLTRSYESNFCRHQ